MTATRGASRLQILLGISAVVVLLGVAVLRMGTGDSSPRADQASPSAGAQGERKSAGTTPAAPEPPTTDVPTPIAARAPLPSAASTEAVLLSKIRETVKTNPTASLAMAREARARFGDSSESDERDKLLVDALINLQKIGAARDETGYYYKHHPDGRFGQYLWTMTGARPDPPSGPTR